jgi:glycyl-tRNA synthetase
MSEYDQIMKLALERGFYFPSCEIYSDALAGFWDYGPIGLRMKNKFIDLWRRELVRRDGMWEIDGSQIMSKKVFIASGHLGNFTDPVVKCTKCNSTFRADRFVSEKTGNYIPERASNDEIDTIIRKHSVNCPRCKGELGPTNRFNMMFKVEVGPSADEAYLRPETCQSIFVDFPRIFKVMRGRLPIAVAQIGKSFRNEIAPRQSLLRLREFYQAEIEVFCNPERLNEVPQYDEVKATTLNIFDGGSSQEVTAQEAVDSGVLPNTLIAYYLAILSQFYSKTGIDMRRTRFRKLSDTEKAFYATIAFDFEVETSLGWLELVACNYRSDYDLRGHGATSKENLEVIDPSSQSKILPHIFELSMGIDRSLYAILEHSYHEDYEHDDRVVLRLKPYLAPITVGVLPLMTKGGIGDKARNIYAAIRKEFDAFIDESGSIGRRYRRLEEIGVPFAITIDKTSMVDETVTIRNRDTMEQERIRISEINPVLAKAVYHYE